MPELVQISTAYKQQPHGEKTIPRNQYVEIREEKPDTPEKAKWPEFKTCKYTAEAIVSDGIDKGELRKVCTEPTCTVHHPKKQTTKATKQAISYCGLCGDEKSSADKVLRMPISKQRNKHIQRVLIEAAKLAARESPELAMLRARELERGNPNRATLAVARKIVAYMLAVERRQRAWVAAEHYSRTAAA